MPASRAGVRQPSQDGRFDLRKNQGIHDKPGKIPAHCLQFGPVHWSEFLSE